MNPLSGIPVTLLIKAANQKLGDHTVECFLDWSVQKLKNHLAKVYPSKPNEKNQRIIYSGKLLKDNLLLKDVLRLDDATLQQHIVHLVCSPSPEELLQSFKPKSESSPSKSSYSADVMQPVPGNSSQGQTTTEASASVGAHSRRQSTPMEPSLPSTHGLRHRTLSTPSFSNFYPYSYGSYPMQYGPTPNQPGYVPANHHQQAMWMQHMYAQQMAHYMQYSNQLAAGGAGLNANLPPVTQAPVVPQPQAPPAQPGAINPPVAPNVAGPDQNVRMNAGLGPAVDDDEDDNVNRDWLDWIYTFCRFSVMLSLVYFYSSLSRFLMVVGLMVFMYMYQKRWFRLRRTPAARERLENRNTEQGDGEQDGINQEEQQQQQQQPPPQNDNTEQDNNSESQEDQQETDSDTPEPAAVPAPEPPKPGVLTIAWIFLSTFFTSLFPQDPNAAAAEN